MVTVSRHEAAFVAREIAVCLDACKTLVEALEICARSTPLWEAWLRRASARLAAGETCADVFRPDPTDPLSRSPLASILATGDLRGHALCLRLPVLGSWLTRQSMVAWLPWVGLMLRRGLRLERAVRSAATACPSPFFEEILWRVAARVEQGSRLSAALAAENFSEFEVWLVGQVETVDLAGPCLTRACDALRRDVDMETHGVMDVVEALAVAAVGVETVRVVHWLYAPSYSLLGTMG